MHELPVNVFVGELRQWRCVKSSSSSSSWKFFKTVRWRHVLDAAQQLDNLQQSQTETRHS
jgi:hypothetical protein